MVEEFLTTIHMERHFDKFRIAGIDDKELDRIANHHPLFGVVKLLSDAGVPGADSLEIYREANTLIAGYGWFCL